jgi:hypothetical protein
MLRMPFSLGTLQFHKLLAEKQARHASASASSEKQSSKSLPVAAVTSESKPVTMAEAKIVRVDDSTVPTSAIAEAVSESESIPISKNCRWWTNKIKIT